MVSRAGDRLKQAIKDYEHSKRSISFEDYERACFAAHQAAEKAVKALYQALGLDVWSRSVSKLLANLPENHKAPEELI